MQTPNAIEQFITTVAEDVRTMPISEARTYLRGLFLLVGSSADIEPLRTIFMKIDTADAQLELIASGQMKLNLGDKADA